MARGPSPLLAYLSIAILAGGCDGSPAPPADAGVDGDAADTSIGVIEPEPPAMPAATSMEPCNEGWQARELETGAVICEPLGAALPTCSGIARAVIGQTECRDVGRPCGADEWPDVSDATRAVYYVREGTPGGDGSLAAPFDTIQAAVTASTGGDIIAIAAGSYGGPSINVFRNVELRGVCAADVVLTTKVVARRARVTLDSVSIVGVDQAILVDEVATLNLRGVAILDAATVALNVTAGGHLFATDLLVRGVRPQPTDGLFGWAVNVDFGSDATVLDSHVEGARGVAFTSLQTGTEVIVEDTVIRDIAQDADGTGRAFTVGPGGSLRASRVVVDESTEFAAVVDGADARLVIEDALIRRTRPRDDGELGGAVACQNAGTLELRRTLLSDNHRAAVQIASRSTATLEDVVVTDTRPEPATAIYGRALLVGSGSDATVRRLHALRSHHAAIIAAGGGTILRLQDVWVRDVAQVAPPKTPYLAGRGLTVGLGARAEVARIRIEEAGDLGILTDDAELEGTDVYVGRTRGEAMMGVLGHGMQTLRSRVSLTRALFEQNRAAGVVVGVAPGEAMLSELAIVDTRERACAETTCPEQGAGIGLTVLQGAHAEISRFSIANGALCGLQLAAGGTADAREGLVAGHPIGANVQTEGFDITRITDDVRYDNVQNLDSSALPVPVVTEE